ncbi:MAG: hypothetical protein ACYC46_00540 [Acidobacteriaceae bacterium]
MMKTLRVITISALLCLGILPASAEVAVLLEEPYGTFGHINPTGHAAIYLSDICAETPTRLRPCHAGELGVVISRYSHIAGYDWIAIPLVPYLYAVDDLKDVPMRADEITEAALRDSYRREHLEAIAPDHQDGSTPDGDWTQLIGAAYIRKIFGFQLETTPEQDAALIRWLNDSKNKSHFNLFFHNCADFARNTMNFLYPGSVHRNYIADLGITTPKQVAKSVLRYSERHAALDATVFVIPQVPGSIPRSRPVDGVAEALVKSKKYVVPLALLQPFFAGSFLVAYVSDGRFHLPEEAPVMEEVRSAEPNLVDPHRKRLPLHSHEAESPSSEISSSGGGEDGLFIASEQRR